MKIPGFTAEASVYKTSERHHLPVAFAHHQTAGAIRPASVSCRSECMHDCLQGGHARPGLCVRLCRVVCQP
jgi:hypothetical protein